MDMVALGLDLQCSKDEHLGDTVDESRTRGTRDKRCEPRVDSSWSEWKKE